MKGGEQRGAQQLRAHIALRFGLREFNKHHRRCGASRVCVTSDIDHLLGAGMQQLRQRLKGIGERSARAGHALTRRGLDPFGDTVWS